MYFLHRPDVLSFHLNCRYYNNAYYAKVGGISMAEMNFLELDFLFGLGFQLNVTPTTFHTYCAYLQREMLSLAAPPTTDIERSIRAVQSRFNEEEDSHTNKQVAAV